MSEVEENGDCVKPGRSVSWTDALGDEMRSAATLVKVKAGETVVYQGDEGRGLFFVESGSLDVVVTAEDGLRLPVARLGPGSHFGEMSLLGGMPISADVVASEPTVLYTVAPTQFYQLIQRRPELVHALAGELAIRLKQMDEQLVAQQQRQSALSRLISSRPTVCFKRDLPSFQRVMMAAVSEAANSDHPVLIAGEKGVGKKALALFLHSMSSRQDKVVLVLDCRELLPEEAEGRIFGEARPEFVSRFADHLGYLQAADRGTLVLASADRLSAEVQAKLAIFLSSHDDSLQESRVTVRVIATIDTPSGSSEGQTGLCDDLTEVLTGGHVIQLQPLRQRRRDVIPLAEHFLQQAAQLRGRPAKQLSESARRKLLSYDFRSDNAEELRQVVSLGVDLADGEEVREEHLFFGAGIGVETPQIDLLRWSWLERQLLRRRHPLLGLKILVAIVFAGIVATCLAVPESRLAQLANLTAWGLWWPALIVLSVLLGRVWCAVCPLSSGAEVVQRASRRGLPPTDRLKGRAPVFALIGFAGIIWVEHTTGMSTSPRPTAILLLSLAAIAALMGWLYQRHTWCRYLCPLGAMCAVFSTASSLRIQARRQVCQASCAGNECYRGSDQAKGCPMFNHALYLNTGQHCKLCLECLRSCPVASPRLVLQLPLRDIWQSSILSADAAPLTIVVGLMALLLAATRTVEPHSLLDGWWFTLGTLAVVVVGLILHYSLQHAGKRDNSGAVYWAGRTILAYAPAVAAVLFAFHLFSLPSLAQINIRVGWGSENLLRLSLLQVCQISGLGLGGLLTLWVLWRLFRQRFTLKIVAAVVAWMLAALGAVAYLVGGLMLLGSS